MSRLQSIITELDRLAYKLREPGVNTNAEARAATLLREAAELGAFDRAVEIDLQHEREPDVVAWKLWEWARDRTKPPPAPPKLGRAVGSALPLIIARLKDRPADPLRIGIKEAAKQYKEHLASVPAFRGLLVDALREYGWGERLKPAGLLRTDPRTVYIEIKREISEQGIADDYPRLFENYERWHKHEQKAIELSYPLAMEAERHGIDSSPLSEAIHTEDDAIIRQAFNVAERLMIIADIKPAPASVQQGEYPVSQLLDDITVIITLLERIHRDYLTIGDIGSRMEGGGGEQEYFFANSSDQGAFRSANERIARDVKELTGRLPSVLAWATEHGLDLSDPREVLESSQATEGVKADFCEGLLLEARSVQNAMFVEQATLQLADRTVASGHMQKSQFSGPALECKQAAEALVPTVADLRVAHRDLPSPAKTSDDEAVKRKKLQLHEQAFRHMIDLADQSVDHCETILGLIGPGMGTGIREFVKRHTTPHGLEHDPFDDDLLSTVIEEAQAIARHAPTIKNELPNWLDESEGIPARPAKPMLTTVEAPKTLAVSQSSRLSDPPSEVSSTPPTGGFSALLTIFEHGYAEHGNLAVAVRDPTSSDDWRPEWFITRGRPRVSCIGEAHVATDNTERADECVSELEKAASQAGTRITPDMLRDHGLRGDANETPAGLWFAWLIHVLDGTSYVEHKHGTRTLTNPWGASLYWLRQRCDKTGNIPLNGTKQNILVAMLELKADHPDRRRSANDIATKATGGDGNSIKRNMSELRRLELVESRRGGGGGSWLTVQGVARAKQLAAE